MIIWNVYSSNIFLAVSTDTIMTEHDWNNRFYNYQIKQYYFKVGIQSHKQNAFHISKYPVCLKTTKNPKLSIKLCATIKIHVRISLARWQKSFTTICITRSHTFIHSHIKIFHIYYNIRQLVVSDQKHPDNTLTFLKYVLNSIP